MNKIQMIIIYQKNYQKKFQKKKTSEELSEKEEELSEKEKEKEKEEEKEEVYNFELNKLCSLYKKVINTNYEEEMKNINILWENNKNKEINNEYFKEYLEKMNIKNDLINFFLELLSIHLLCFSESLKKKIVRNINHFSEIFNVSNKDIYNKILIIYFKEFFINELMKDNVKRKFSAIIINIFNYDKYIIYLFLKNNINPINWFLIKDKNIYQERNLITDHEQIMKLCHIQIHPTFLNNLVNLSKIKEKTKKEIMKIDLYKHLFVE